MHDAMLVQVLAMAQWLSVLSRSSAEQAGQIELVFDMQLSLSYPAMYYNEIQRVLSSGTWPWPSNFVRNSGLRNMIST